jgi:2-alkenal reductase
MTAILLIAFGFILGTTALRTTAGSALFVAQPDAQLHIPDPITENERFFASIYNRVSPSVVSISVIGTSQGNSFSASGTGFVIDQQGHVVTNNHVVDGADSNGIQVNFLDGTIVRGQIVGLDPDSDLAVLKVDMPAERLNPVQLGDSDALFIGETTLAIGSPFGQRWTLTSGIISALDRTITGLTNFSVGAVIQTDAAINPGNSGGPLLNLQGEVIGVNSQILSESRSNSGIGFAIPSNLVKRVSAELIASGVVNYSYLGISSVSDERGMTMDMIEAYRLPNNLRGVVISDIVPNGPADQAGIHGATNRSVDVITAIDGVPLNGMSSLVSYLANFTKPGQTVTLTVYRDGQTIMIPLVLGERPSR